MLDIHVIKPDADFDVIAGIIIIRPDDFSIDADAFLKLHVRVKNSQVNIARNNGIVFRFIILEK